MKTLPLLLLVLLYFSPAIGLSREAEPLTYRLKWLFNTSVVGDLYADRLGFFDEQDLQVTVKAGGPERDAIKELELGYADFGVASADQVIRAVAKGSPVVVICQLFQVNPLQWIYRTGAVTLDSLSDLKGKKIGVTFGGNDEAILRAILAEGGLKERDVHLFSVRYDYTPFYKKQVNIWPVYRNAQGIILADKLQAEGEQTGFFEPARFGVEFVANSVVTSRRMVEENPDTVKRFLAALLKGWRQALAAENEKAAVAALQEHDREISPDTLSRQLEATRNIVLPEGNFPMGSIDIPAWLQTEGIMRSQGLIKETINIESVLIPDFLPEASQTQE